MAEKEYIERNALIAEYDRVHIGPAGGARKLMVDAPACDVAPKSEVAREVFEEIDSMCIDLLGNFDHSRFIELKKKYTEDQKGGNNG